MSKSNNVKPAPVAPVVVVSPAAPTRDPMGNRYVTRSHVINAAIFKLCGANNAPIKLKQIVECIKLDPQIAALAKQYCEAQGKGEVGAIPAHLRYLQGHRNGSTGVVAVPQITLTPLGYVLCEQHIPENKPAPKGKGKAKGKPKGK